MTISASISTLGVADRAADLGFRPSAPFYPKGGTTEFKQLSVEQQQFIANLSVGIQAAYKLADAVDKATGRKDLSLNLADPKVRKILNKQLESVFIAAVIGAEDARRAGVSGTPFELRIPFRLHYYLDMNRGKGDIDTLWHRINKLGPIYKVVGDDEYSTYKKLEPQTIGLAGLGFVPVPLVIYAVMIIAVALAATAWAPSIATLAATRKIEAQAKVTMDLLPCLRTNNCTQAQLDAALKAQAAAGEGSDWTANIKWIVTGVGVLAGIYVAIQFLPAIKETVKALKPKGA